ncbi:hypothetical protein JCM33374_g3388 [Metschnikowia sp. JCM 33374]|nr:hypothetical protein JCM33374_g3388 [Metschnikowia sp. JCM 33374]
MTSYHIERNTKYDRQIRLWAQDGQSRLENTHVCLINANPAGAETLKNLVLPGVGSFTIVDDAVVSADDLSGNFFLEQKHLGEGIASSMAECLQELNPDVKGAHIDSSLEDLLVHSEVWGKFSIVVISGHVRAESLQKLTNILWDRNIPLLVVVNTGFYASLAVLARETTVVETHDPSKTYDLRIDCPWPELSDYSSAFDLLQLDDTEHAHVPYIVIFIQALEKWRTDHGGYLPQNYAEKREFRSGYIEKMARNINVETNFIEASRSVHRALQVTRIPNSIQDLLSRSEISDQYLGPETPEFWLYVRALKSFVHKNGGKLPLPGNIPDMASTTTNYVQLQNIYRNKADADKHSFIAELVKVYQNAGRDVADICPESVSAFCKNAAFLLLPMGRSLYISNHSFNNFMHTMGSMEEGKKHPEI